MISIYSRPLLSVLDGLTDSLMDLAKTIFENSLWLFLKFASFKDVLNASYGIMPQYIEQNGKWILKPGVVSPLLRIGQSYGAALALIFLLVAMADIYMQEKMSIETFVKPFLQYLATVILMVNCEKLVAFFWNFGVLFQKSLSEADLTTQMQNFNVVFDKSNTSVGTAIGLALAAYLLLIVCFFIGAIIRICAYIANFSRMIEAAVRAVGFPIAIGISVDSNLRQGAVRYLKKFFAVALQGGIFVAVSIIFTLTAAAVVTDRAEKMSGVGQETVNAIEKEPNYRWDETAQTWVGIVTETPSGSNNAAITVGINAGNGITAALYTIFTSIIPLIGLGLACIVVLFKSGQICNDIVGA